MRRLTAELVPRPRALPPRYIVMSHDFTRQELYDLVWSEPIQKLAKRFGLSDVGLAKACRSADIPRPGRGYYGHSDEERANEVIPPRPAFPEGLEALTALHPLIARVLETEEARRQEVLERGWALHKPAHGGPAARRRLRLRNAIFLAANRCGCRPVLDDHDRLEAGAVVGDARVPVVVAPIAGRTRRRREGAGGRPAEPLACTIGGQQRRQGIPLVWEDRDDAPLEQQLTEIVVGVLVAGEMEYRAAPASCNCNRSFNAVRRYQSSAMCNSLAGSHSRAATSAAAIFSHGTSSLPTGRCAAANSSRRQACHSASAWYTLPNSRPFSMRTPFNRTPSVCSRVPSSTRSACSGAPISARASARARSRPASSSSPRWATVCWITRRPMRTDRTNRHVRCTLPSFLRVV
jgi:hypothetical protein